MKSTLKKFIKKLFLQFVSIKDISLEIEKQNVIECLKGVKIGQKSNFYKESKVFNLRNDRSAIQIGDGTHIRGELIVFPYGGKIRIGDNCYIGEGSRIWSGESIIIGDNVGIAHNINIVDFAHETNYLKRAEGVRNTFENGHPTEKGDIPTAPIIIEDYVAIYPNSSILRGVKIGKGAIVSTGSVVMSDVAAFTIVMGNPARVMGKIPSN